MKFEMATSSSNTNTLFHSFPSVSNWDDYDCDASNFVPPTPTNISMAMLGSLDGAIPLIDRLQEHLNDARQYFLRIMRPLPYGNSVFFGVCKVVDPSGLLPGRIILGVNERGVHFFRPSPKEYLYSLKLHNIFQFGSNNTAVFFKMSVAGPLRIFQLETKQGEEICVALQTHINDIMLRRSSKAKSDATGSILGDSSCNLKTHGVEAYEKRVQDLTKGVEESQRNAEEINHLQRNSEIEHEVLKHTVAELEKKLEEDWRTFEETSLKFELWNAFKHEHGPKE